MAAAAILKITLLAISRPFLYIFAPNLKHRLKMGSCSQIYHQNSHSAKIQDGGGYYYEISYKAITRPFLNGFALNLTQIQKLGSRNWFFPAKLISHKIQDGGCHHIENDIFGRKSSIIAYICTEFDTGAENVFSCSQI